jgi:hypothetical protein
MNDNREQVFMGLELVATALDLADKLLEQPSGIDWFKVAAQLKREWYDSIDFDAVVKNEPDLMLFLKEQVIDYSGMFDT